MFEDVLRRGVALDAQMFRDDFEAGRVEGDEHVFSRCEALFCFFLTGVEDDFAELGVHESRREDEWLVDLILDDLHARA